MKKFYIKLYRINYLLTALLLVLTILFASFIGFLSKDRIKKTLEASTEPSGITVILDAGHGGEDPGASTSFGAYEKDINMEITLIIGEMLKEKGYNVVYTRTEDKLLYTEEENVKGLRKINDLKNRCKVAEGYDDPIFISIHQNSFAKERYSGLQVYYSVGNEESYSLASAVQNRVISDVQPNNNRRVKEGKNIYLMEKLRCTSVLIECGFLTNPEESRLLCEKEYQKILSFSIVCGIIEYIERK